MNPMAAAVTGALISGLAVYAVGARASQNDLFEERPALVQTVDGQLAYVPNARPVTQPMGFVSAPAPAAYTPVAYTPAARTVYREPAQVTRVVQRDEVVRPTRSKTKTALIIGGSAASGAGVGAMIGGKKGALIGAALGGGAASIYEATKRR